MRDDKKKKVYEVRDELAEVRQKLKEIHKRSASGSADYGGEEEDGDGEVDLVERAKAAPRAGFGMDR